jgi:hypothetical protein
MRGLQTTAGVLAYDLFQQVLESAHKISTGFEAVMTSQADMSTETLSRPSLSFLSSASTGSGTAGPFQRSLHLHHHDQEATPTAREKAGRTSHSARPPLSTITNTAARHDTSLLSDAPSSVSKSRGKRHADRGAVEGDWSRWQELAWEPVLVDQVYLLQVKPCVLWCHIGCRVYAVHYSVLILLMQCACAVAGVRFFGQTAGLHPRPSQ